jgi:hypothetical protein
MYIFVHDKYWSAFNRIRERVDINLTHIRNALKKLNPEFVFDYSYVRNGQIEWGEHKIFLRIMENITRDYKDLLDEKIEVEYGTRTARREIVERRNYVTLNLRTLEYVSQGPPLPRMFLVVTLIVCSFPILYAFMNLGFIMYKIPISEWSGIIILIIDFAAIVSFCVSSFVFTRSMRA